MRRIVLASASEGRQELFRQHFSDFLVQAMNIPEENYLHLPIEEMVSTLAEEKAKTCVKLFPEDFIFAFDTMVACEGNILGKPKDKNEAKRMLHALSGKKQEVYTGYGFIFQDHYEKGVEKAIVTFQLNSDEIEHYINNHPVCAYAGAYAIQKEDTKAELLSGSFDVVVGTCIEKTKNFYQKYL